MGPIQTFIRRPIFTSMLVLSVVVFGAFAYPRIGVDQFPDVEFPVVTVLTVLPGADPETIERNVSEPLEEALNTLGGVDQLRSVNVDSVSQVIIRFTLDKDVDVAAQDVRDRVQATLRKLPAEIETPVVEKFDIGAAPIMTLAMSGSLPIQELTRVAEDVLKPALQRIDGVGSIDVIGGRKREITIDVDPTRLRALGLAVSDVVQTIRAQSVDIPGGRTAEATTERVVKVDAQARSVEELRQLVIAAPLGAPIRIRDVANIIDGPEEARSAATLDGQSAVGLVLRKQSGANTVAVAARVMESISELRAGLPQGTDLQVVSDGARFIRASIESVQHDLVLGGVLAVLIVLVFLRNLRSTLVSAVALPVSVVGTFAAIHALGFTFNVVTMLALTLSIGLLIDDAIVVIENIIRHMERGASPFQAALEGTKEIAVAVLAVTLSLVAVFIPVAFMEGIMGQFFYQFGVTVAVSVMISYVVSMTLTPMFSSRLLRPGHEHSHNVVSERLERFFVGLEQGYRTLLGRALARPGITLAVAFGVFVLTIGMARFLKFTFMPQQDMSMFKISIEMPLGSTLDATQREVVAIAEQARALPGVERVFTTAGGGLQAEVHKGEILVNLVPLAQRAFGQQDIKQYLRERLVRRADVNVSLVDYSPVSGGGSRPQQVQFNIRGDDWDEVLTSVEKVRGAMLANPGLVDVDTTYRSGKPQLNVAIDRDRAAALTVPAAVVGTTVRAFLGGDKVGDYREAGDTIDIKLRLPAHVLADPQAIGALAVRSPTGQLVELRNVAQIEAGSGPSQIDREALKRQVTLLADLKGYSLGEAIGFLNDFSKKNLPRSVSYDFEGQGRELAKAGVAFLLAIVLGVILVYMILAAQFESLVHPFTIMLALPLAIVGAIGGLLISGQFLSMFAMIGIIMLMGLVTKNGILLVEFTNQLRERGMSTVDALQEAGPVRLRPILMTTVAMIAGMIPVALARGDGAETRVPMAVAIIGGLITSTALTLVVVPVVYALMDRLALRFGFGRAENSSSDRGPGESSRENEALEGDTVAGAERRRTA